MLERLQVIADLNGLVTADGIEVFDAPILTDPVTDAPTRGDLRKVVLPLDVRQRLAAAINAELGGSVKAAERLSAARTKSRETPRAT